MAVTMNFASAAVKVVDALVLDPSAMMPVGL